MDGKCQDKAEGEDEWCVTERRAGQAGRQAGQGRAGQGRAGQGRAGQGKVRQGREGQGRVG